MFFNSLEFPLFFAVTFGLCWLVRRHVAARNAVLLVASYAFYACWDWRFLALIWIPTLVDYTCGRLLSERVTDARARRLVLLASVGTNLAILGFFKYFNFFIASLGDLLGALGMQAHLPALAVLLPIGLSFYTFRTLSYVIDVYRGHLEGERSLLSYALYVAFFPELVAGPIERAGALLPQLREPSRLSWPSFSYGVYLWWWGVFKKVVIADNVAGVVATVFGARHPSGGDVLIGMYAFTIQIYCDFSGYTDMARGVARCLGFDTMINFDLPYFATNPSDFWRRWHISLSSWLRDYLYIPLGGNRGSTARTYVNLMLTMVLGGLWHGAAWTFVLWGAYHGALLCVHRAAEPWLARVRPAPGSLWASLWFWLRVAVFFQLVAVGWLVFRAESFGQVLDMIRAVVAGQGGTAKVVDVQGTATFVCCAVALLGTQLLQWRSGDIDFVYRLRTPMRAAVYVVLFLSFIAFGEYGGDAFIYAAF
jgi:alginate O-acetyltransferase complex protein AlgI